MLSLNDLDFESTAGLKKQLHEQDKSDALRDIKETRRVLGQFSVRDTVEAVYGDAYAQRVFGDEGGKDVLMEELSARDDLIEAAGGKRTDVGDNRLGAKNLSDLEQSDRGDLRSALADQEELAEKAAHDSVDTFFKEDGKVYKKQNIVEDISNMLPEEKEEIIRLLMAQPKMDKD
jgi:hypothetical protein